MTYADDSLLRLRDDLGIQFFDREHAATVQLYDPIRHRYFELSETSTQILRLWHLGRKCAVVSAAEKANVELTAKDLQEFEQFLVVNSLVKIGGDTTNLLRQKQLGRSFRVRFGHLLFFRLPLGNPMPMLTLLAPLLSPLLSRGFFGVSLTSLAIGLYLLSGMPQQVEHQLFALATKQGVLPMIAAGVVGKFVHELGHALQAVKRNVSVTSFGVLIALGLPLPYTDVGGAWSLARARDRMFIAGGGLLAEFVLACWMILLFGLLPDGPLRTAVFSVATISILLSLTVNLNPLMRFDGYFLLSDFLGIKNLHTRSNAVGKWWLRRMLFALKDPPPEEFDHHLRKFAIVFAQCVWIFRLSLFGGIAALMLALLPLAIGLPLAVTTVGLLIGRPVWVEIRFWISRYDDILTSTRSWVFLLILAAGTALAFVPTQNWHRLPARLIPSERIALNAPRQGIVKMRGTFDPKNVRKGQVLWRLNDPDLVFEAEQVQIELAQLELQLSRLSTSSAKRAQLNILQEQIRLRRARQKKLESMQNQMTFIAPLNGSLSAQHSDFIEGVSIARGTELATIEDFSERRIMALVSDDIRKSLDWNTSATFVDSTGREMLENIAFETLGDRAAGALDEAEFLTSYGGPIPPSAAEDLSPEGTWYRLESVSVDGFHIPKMTISGTLLVRSLPESAVSRISRHVLEVLSQAVTLR